MAVVSATFGLGNEQIVLTPRTGEMRNRLISSTPARDATGTAVGGTLEAVAGLMSAFIPGRAGVVFLEAGAGIDDQQRADALRMYAIKRQRHVAAER